MRKTLLTTITAAILVAFASVGYSQVADQTSQKKYQAKAPPTQPFGKEAFGSSKETTIRWLGMGGFLINSRGTTIMVDPLLKHIIISSELNLRG